jgi:hypothetical protein
MKLLNVFVCVTVTDLNPQSLLLLNPVPVKNIKKRKDVVKLNVV